MPINVYTAPFLKKKDFICFFFRTFAKRCVTSYHIYGIVEPSLFNININRMANKILFINQEIYPYVPQSEMSDMGRELPTRMQDEGLETRTFMPKWGNINERRGQLHEVIRLSGMNLIIDDTDHPLIIKVASIPQTRLQVYFIDNDDFFVKRLMAVDETGKEYADNGERAIFFARGVLETVKKLRWNPDIIHCQGWMSSIVPIYVKKAYNNEPAFANTKIVLSLFNDRLSQSMGANFKKCIEFKGINIESLSAYNDNFDFNELEKMAVDYSDAVIEAEPNAKNELLEYAADKGLPVLKYAAEDYIQKYQDLYNSILKK